MIKFYTLLLLIGGMICSYNNSFAQLTVSGEYRPRAEYRHGFGTLPVPDQRSAFFIDQRTRFNASFLHEKYELKIVFQDVRVWGSQPQLTANDGNLTTMHEAWGKVNLTEAFSLKLGRQEIIYDDHRIFGNVGWAQQARSHDAALLIFEPAKTKIHIGLAFNQDKPQLNTTFYTVPNSYKSFQYLWANRTFTDQLKMSFLFLNNGKQGGTPDDYKTYFSQTFGTRLSYSGTALKANFAIYKQTGNEPDGATDISAEYIAADATYSFTPNTSLTGGFEYMSGNDPASTNNENNAFNPFYGTNHKFNGLMDYFYVGNHVGSIGLQDLYVGVNQKIGKVSANLTTHFFSSPEQLPSILAAEKMDKYLGTEVDLVMNYKVSGDIAIQGGYSQMFATSSMEALKGGNKNETSNWAWIMMTIKPVFFTTKKEENAN